MKILCFGSLNLDYVYQVDHILAPGETLTAKSFQIFDGGKGLNQAIALGRAQADCYMAGMIGQDGMHLLEILQGSDVKTQYVHNTGEKSGHTIIQVDKTGQNCIMYFPGANQMITESYVNQVLEFFDSNDYVLLQNEICLLPYIMEKASQKGIKIVFNPSPITDELLNYPIHLVDLLIFNEIEGHALTCKSDEYEMIDTLHALYPNTKFLLTLGRKGVLYSDGVVHLTHGIYNTSVVDTTAAGDTFTGYFLSAFTGNKTIAECLRIASVASSIAVSRQGAAPSIPVLSEVLSSNLSKTV